MMLLQLRDGNEKAPGRLGPGLGKVTVRWVSGWSYDYDGFLGWIKRLGNIYLKIPNLTLYRILDKISQRLNRQPMQVTSFA